MQKFKTGDRVRIIGYGHPSWLSKASYKEDSKHLSIIGTQMDYQLMFGKEAPAEVLDKIQGKDIPEHIIEETETHWIVDVSPELVGREGVVLGSYHSLYGSENDPEKIARNMKSYSLEGIKGKSAWYSENQIELIK